MSWVEDWTCRIPRLPSRDQLTLETALLHGRSLSLLPDGAPASRVHHTTPTDTLTPKKNPPPPPPPPRSPKFNVEGVRAAQMLWPRFRRDRGSTLNLGDRGEGGGGREWEQICACSQSLWAHGRRRVPRVRQPAATPRRGPLRVGIAVSEK